jgi:hypothetical protein
MVVRNLTCNWGVALLGTRRTIAAALAVAALGGTAAAASAETITPADPGGWTFEARNTSGYAFLPGPDGATGVGSLQIVTGPNRPTSIETPENIGRSGKVYVSLPSLEGTRLEDLTTLTYRAYISPTSATGSTLNVGINLPVDRDGDGTWDTLLVYEPYYLNKAQPKGVWQSLDALADDARWWSTDVADRTCNGGDFCYLPFDEWLDRWDDPVITGPGHEANLQPFPGGLSFVAGERDGTGWQNFAGYLDEATIGVDGVETTYDFEPSTSTTTSVHADNLGALGFEAVSESRDGAVIGGNATNQRGIVLGPDSTWSYRMQLATLEPGEERAKESLYYRAAAGRTVGELTRLSYRSYESEGNGYKQAPYITIGVNDTRLETAGNYTGLVYDPDLNKNRARKPVQLGEWQTWEPFAADALWRCTRAFTLDGLSCPNDFDGVVRWADLQAVLGDAVINQDGIQFSLGSTGTSPTLDGIEAFLADLTIGFGTTPTTFSFGETPPPPPPPPPAPTPTPEPEPAPVPPPASTQPPVTGQEESVSPPAPSRQQIREARSEARETLGARAKVDRAFDLGGKALVLVPTVDRNRQSNTPVVRGSQVRFDPASLRRGQSQNLLALSCPTVDCTAKVTITIRYRDSRGRLRTIEVAASEQEIAAGGVAAVTLNLPRSVRQQILRGGNVRMTVAIDMQTADGQPLGSDRRTLSLKTKKSKRNRSRR